MFSTITNGKYWIVNEHVSNNFQDIVLTLGTITSMANIVVKGVMMKEEPKLVFHGLKFYILMVKSLFIDLYVFSDENDPSLLDVVISLCVNFQPTKK
jgi:hypothetical protein